MNNDKKLITLIIIISITLSSITGGTIGFLAGNLAINKNRKNITNTKVINDSENKTINNQQQESIKRSEAGLSIVDTVDKVLPSVVSVIVTKDVPVYERYYQKSPESDFFSRFFGDDFFGGFDIPQQRQKGTEKKEVGGGSGFIISSDGYILTNKHVVSDEKADYSIIFNDNNRADAKVLARDPFNDIAILKVDKKDLKFLDLGDSGKVKIGQSVIAIGNALGEFRNSVSTGVISGLSRLIVAGGADFGSEQLTGVIQTDASINPGNSGGPLLNLDGQVIGINTAVSTQGQNIGFALPINEAKKTYESVKKHGRIIRPWLGVRYVQIDDEIAKKNNLKVNYGALILRGENQSDLAVIPGSPANKAGLEENDIILEVNNQKIDQDNPLSKVVGKYNVGEEINLKILKKGVEKNIKLKLEEMKN